MRNSLTLPNRLDPLLRRRIGGLHPIPVISRMPTWWFRNKVIWSGLFGLLRPAVKNGRFEMLQNRPMHFLGIIPFCVSVSYASQLYAPQVANDSINFLPRTPFALVKNGRSCHRVGFRNAKFDDRSFAAIQDTLSTFGVERARIHAFTPCDTKQTKTVSFDSHGLRVEVWAVTPIGVKSSLCAKYWDAKSNINRKNKNK